jgi:hypothetical protein
MMIQQSTSAMWAPPSPYCQESATNPGIHKAVKSAIIVKESCLHLQQPQKLFRLLDGAVQVGQDRLAIHPGQTKDDLVTPRQMNLR